IHHHFLNFSKNCACNLRSRYLFVTGICAHIGRANCFQESLLHEMHTITKDVNGKGKKTSASNAEDVCTDLPCTTSLLDFKLRRAQLLAFQDFSESLSQLKIRPAEFSVLAMIAQHPGQKQTTIAEMLGIKRANFVFLMDSIESRGLAVRRK